MVDGVECMSMVDLPVQGLDRTRPLPWLKMCEVMSWTRTVPEEGKSDKISKEPLWQLSLTVRVSRDAIAFP